MKILKTKAIRITKTQSCTGLLNHVQLGPSFRVICQQSLIKTILDDMVGLADGSISCNNQLWRP